MNTIEPTNKAAAIYSAMPAMDRSLFAALVDMVDEGIAGDIDPVIARHFQTLELLNLGLEVTPLGREFYALVPAPDADTKVTSP